MRRAVLLAFLLAICAAPADAYRVETFPVPTEEPPVDAQMIRGPDGHVWFIAGPGPAADGGVGAMTPAGMFRRIDIGRRDNIYGLATGADGNVWVGYFKETQADVGGVARITPAGQFTLFSSAFGAGGQATAGPDGAVWYAPGGGVLDRVAPDGSITEVAFSDQPVSGSDIALGSDKRFYIPSLPLNQVYAVSPAGELTIIPVTVAPRAATLGPDGNIYVGGGTNRIARITPQGQVTAVPVPFLDQVVDMTAAADGGVYFTTNRATIGRLDTRTLRATAYPLVGRPRTDIPTAVTSTADALYFNGLGPRRAAIGRLRFCRVPNLVGLTLARARRALGARNCRSRVVTPRRYRKRKGLVVRKQVPKAGALIAPDGAVRVTLGPKRR